PSTPIQRLCWRGRAQSRRDDIRSSQVIESGQEPNHAQREKVSIRRDSGPKRGDNEAVIDESHNRTDHGQRSQEAARGPEFARGEQPHCVCPGGASALKRSECRYSTTCDMPAPRTDQTTYAVVRDPSSAP